MTRRLSQSLVAVLLAAGAVACSTVDGPSPDVGTLRPAIRDGSLGSQSSLAPTFQIMRWQIPSFDAAITEAGGTTAFSFLPLGACDYSDNILQRGDLKDQCRGYTGIALDKAKAATITFHLEISSLQTIRADRPSLLPSGDEDGDGVSNLSDSCKLVPNPGQTSSTDYTACSIKDEETGQVIASDQDLDAVRDSFDNCLWIPNPADSENVQADSNRDGIGDACTIVVPVFIPGSTVRLECPATFPDPDGTYIIDFADRVALTCDPGLNSCALDPTKVTIRPLTAPEEGPASSPCVVAP